MASDLRTRPFQVAIIGLGFAYQQSDSGRILALKQERGGAHFTLSHVSHFIDLLNEDRTSVEIFRNLAFRLNHTVNPLDLRFAHPNCRGKVGRGHSGVYSIKAQIHLL
jgi:hypothetical protein